MAAADRRRCCVLKALEDWDCESDRHDCHREVFLTYSCIEHHICPCFDRDRGTIWEIWETAVKEIFLGGSRETFCLCFCPYLCLFLLFYRLASSDLGLLMSFQLGQCRANVNDEEREDQDCGSSEAC